MIAADLKDKCEHYLRAGVMSIITAINELCRWSTLRSVGSSPVVRLSIAAPFVGYMIIFNSELQSLLTLVEPLFSDVSQGNASSNENSLEAILSKRFELLYIGLIFIGLASITYVRGPRECKQYPDEVAYVGAENDITSYADLNPYVAAKISNLLEGIEDVVSYNKFLFEMDPQSDAYATRARTKEYLWQFRKSDRFDALRFKDDSEEERAFLRNEIVMDDIRAQNVGLYQDGRILLRAFKKILYNIDDLRKMGIDVSSLNELYFSLKEKSDYEVIFDKRTRNEFLKISYRLNNMRYPGFRIITGAFYSFGFVLLGLVSAVATLKVLTKIF